MITPSNRASPYDDLASAGASLIVLSILVAAFGIACMWSVGTWNAWELRDEVQCQAACRNLGDEPTRVDRCICTDESGFRYDPFAPTECIGPDGRQVIAVPGMSKRAED